MGSRPRTGREVVLRTALNLDREIYLDLGIGRRIINYFSLQSGATSGAE
jgi:hypothetical protein